MGQLKERSLQDGAMDQIYDMIVEHCGALSHSISFPELVIPAVVRMKKFLKTTSASRFIKLVKQMLALIQENSSFIEAKRKSVSFGVSDLAAVDKWETEVREKGTPLRKYLETYKVKRIEELRMADATRDQEKEEKEESKKRKGEEKKGTSKKRKRDEEEEEDEDEDDEDMVDLTEEDFANAGSGSEEDEEEVESDFNPEEFKGELSKKKLSKSELKKLKAQKDVVEEFDLGDSDEEKPDDDTEEEEEEDSDDE